MENIAELKRFKKSFLLHSSRYNVYSEETVVKGAVATHNRAVVSLGKLEDKVSANPSLYSELLWELLHDDDLKTSLSAGLMCLEANIHTEKAIERLVYIAQNTPGISMICSFDISGTIAKFKRRQMEAKPRNEIDALAEKMKTSDSGQTYPDEELLNIISGLSDINKCGYDDRTPLFYACQFNRFALVKQLVELGAEIDKRDYTEKTALHAAAILGNIDSVVLLLKSGANVNAQDKRGFTALDFAKANPARLPQEKLDKLLDLLISYGAKSKKELLSNNQ